MNDGMRVPTASVIDARGSGDLDKPITPPRDPGGQGAVSGSGQDSGRVVESAGGRHAGCKLGH